MLQTLIAAPRWLFLGTLAYAPWAYGCTVAWTIDGFVFLAALTIGFWVAGCIAQRRVPEVDGVSVFCVAWLLAQGWVMALNPESQHSAAGMVFNPVAPLWGAAPGSVDGAVSVAMMLRVSALLGLLLVVGDLAREPLWRWRIWWTAALAGAALVFFGLTQRALDAPSIFWLGTRGITAFFASYAYPGNAGAFINLVFPLAAGLAWAARSEEWSLKKRGIAIVAAGVCIPAVWVNSSRSAFAIACLSAVVLAAWMLRRFRDHETRSIGGSFSGSVAAIALVTMVLSVGWESSAQKWALLPHQLNASNPRLLAVSACLKMLPDAGLWGFGPGTFQIVFPHYTHFLGDTIRGTWRYAHQDYLQAVIEWGWAGAAAWVVLFASGMVRCFFQAADAVGERAEQTMFFATGVALAGIALHAMVDFPLQITSLQLYVVALLGIASGKRRTGP